MPQYANLTDDQKTALLAAIVESSDDAIISKDLKGTVTSWNRGAERIFGYSADEMIGRNISLLFPEDRVEEEAVIIGRIQAGERVDHFETVRRRKDGRLIIVSLAVSPVRAADGTIIGASKVARDITERKWLEETQRVLSREVNHRSKNLLAIVEAIARQTAQHSSPADFPQRMSERLRALSINQDLLLEGDWRGAEVSLLTQIQLGHVDAALPMRITTQGGPLLLNPAATQALGMALHELATNAMRHGALSSRGGTVAISWGLDEGQQEPVIVLVWREIGGPEVSPPTRVGFGTTILNRITAQAVSGEVHLRYEPDGLVWELRAPARLMLAETGEPVPFALVQEKRRAAV